MFKELFTEAQFKGWKKFAKTIQQAANTAKIKVEQIRVVKGQNGESIEILDSDAKNLERLRDEVLKNFINSKMKMTLSYTGSDNKSGTPILSVYEV